MAIYLDNPASTKVCPEAAKAAYLTMTEFFANPSSPHTAGQEAERIVKQARAQIARSLGVGPQSIVFTSGGTESDNLALLSAFFTAPGSLGGPGGAFKKKALLVSTVEHAAVRSAAAYLAERGVRVKPVAVLPADSAAPGMLDPRSLRDELEADTGLVSVMHVNNEIGTIQPIEEIAGIVKEAATRYSTSIPIHSDAVQSYGKLPIDAGNGEFRDIDFIALSAHKIHGPKGVGALYASAPGKLHPMLFGGGQENGLRSGTENVPGIAGFAAAAKLMTAEIVGNAKAANTCRRHLLEGLLAEVPEVVINSPADASVTGKPGLCSPYILNVSFPGARGEVLVHELERKGIYISTGAACSSQRKEEEAKKDGVLAAIGCPPEVIASAVRFGFSCYDDPKDMDIVVQRVKEAALHLRSVGQGR
ncbi:MAG: cysteine desulfurase [Clostridiales bacterium]|nr:cysteine desulfurase [Clostridiales bacterium]